MARTLYLRDGTTETLLCGDDLAKQMTELERILREHLGDDAAAFLREILDPEQNSRAALAWDLRDLEISCDSYRSALQDVLCGLGKIADFLVNDKRLDRKKIDAVLHDCIKTIDNEL